MALCPSVCHKLEFIKTAKFRVTQATHMIAQGIYFSDAKDLSEISPGSPAAGVPNAGGVGQNLQL